MRSAANLSAGCIGAYPRGVFSSLGRGRALAATGLSVTLCLGPFAHIAQAADVAPVDPAPVASVQLAAPAIAAVVRGDGELGVNYAVDPQATGYQLRVDNGPWQDCAAPAGTCHATGLTNGRHYRLWLRAIGSSGQGAIAGPAGGVPLASQDPDRPAAVTGKEKLVTAIFNAAGNSLGANASRSRLGVGTLPTITFSTNIPNKAAVERHLVVTAMDPAGNTSVVEGAWGWLGDRTAMFRPRAFWPAKSTIDISSSLGGVVLGKQGSRTLVGASGLDRIDTFATARSLVARVDGKSKRMKVIVDGRWEKTFKVSLGGAAWETRNGVKVISTAKEPQKTYRSESLGITDPEEAYELDAPWNTRLTPSGEFIHAAPWAYGRLGRYNGSHGCTNMFEDDARWIFEHTIPGDIVVYTNTGGPTSEPWNGPGGMWNVPWKRWLAKSATYAKGAVDSTPESGSVSDITPASA